MKDSSCKYVYKHKAPSGLSNVCSVSSLFGNWEEAVPYLQAKGYNDGEILALSSAIPTCSDGCCIFHSANVEWKNTMQFELRVYQLLYLLRYLDHKWAFDTKVDLREFTFSEAVFIEGFQTCNLRFHLDCSIFLKELSIEAGEWNNLSFVDSIFHGEVAIVATHAGGLNFHHTTHHQPFSIEDSSFSDFSDFSRCDFKEYLFFSAVFSTEVSFARSTFKAMAPTTINCEFQKFVDFSYCVFDTLLLVQNCVFHFEANFTGTVFRTRVFFEDPIIYSTFIIQKESSEEPVFQDLVNFSIKEEDLHGRIIFKEVSFMNINEPDRVNLLDLHRKNKVIIGKGCIKYRHQTLAKRIEIDQQNQNLILEIVTTFANFFTDANSYHLGVEIVERSADYIVLFFFSDEDIHPDEFQKRLEQTEQDLWSLLFINKEKIPTKEAAAKPSVSKKLINTVDGISALIGIFFRVGIRISLLKWTEQNTKALMQAINFSETMVIAPRELHTVIVNNYHDERLLDFSRNQHQHIRTQINTRSYIEHNNRTDKSN